MIESLLLASAITNYGTLVLSYFRMNSKLKKEGYGFTSKKTIREKLTGQIKDFFISAIPIYGNFIAITLLCFSDDTYENYKNQLLENDGIYIIDEEESIVFDDDIIREKLQEMGTEYLKANDEIHNVEDKAYINRETKKEKVKKKIKSKKDRK